MMKLMGNSSYGKCITDFLKHETVKIVTGDNYIKNIRRNNYIEHQDLNQGCEFRFKKMSFKQSLPIHIRFQVYQLAKLRMLQFYYDSIDYSIDKSDYQYCMMDTDSAYIAISDESLEVIKPSLKDEFKKNRHLWLERDDTIENKVYDSRTPGLFKLEYEGNCIISLASKIRKAFVVAIKSKSQTTEAMRFVFAARKPILVQSDNGTEFLNNSFQQLLKEYVVRQITVNVGDHNRQGLIESINDTPESRYQANPKTGTIKSKALNTQIKIGDKVRILIEKGTFTKGLNHLTHTNEQVERERPMSNKERRNKRELEELERIPEPKNKRRKIFQGTYFLENYYTQNKESKRLRYRNNYANNSDIERGRLQKYKKA
ncbi:hypothetical protein BDEG_24597 [Batrachochytrium dendrobatidis JEL423]|uniref:Integrase catalytic domain-containing protein n=1 Tax=Batrachochytrium dendrobatidis (strain JEL423) TaxID=403673 RepID=A0A177WMM9_BATDL|nr:hypothetical protein BDEG_24597 [Batrachochytrium dendrobatidis JEL423]